MLSFIAYRNKYLIFVDLFDIFICFLSIEITCRRPLHIDLPKKKIREKLVFKALPRFICNEL